MSTPDAIASWLAQRYPLQRALCLQLGRDLTEARLAGDTARPLSDAVGGQLLACGAAASDPLLAPLTFRGGRLAWSACVRDEIQIAEALRSRAAAAPLRASAGQVAIINAGRDGSQDHAVRTVVERRLAVIVGGPGTGKTTTVLRALQAVLAGGPQIIRLAAPTGKAAARLRASIEHGLGRQAGPHDAVLRTAAAATTTVHRLLGWDASAERFRLGLRHPLVADLVVIDEVSMLDIHLAAALLRALPPQTRLVLVGDDAQLPSVEAGAVLRDAVAAAEGDGSLAGSLARLTTVHRQKGDAAGLRVLAPALRSGDILATEAAFSAGHADIQRAAPGQAWPLVRSLIEPWATAVLAAADPAAALAALGRMLVLCATREGPWSVADLHRRIEGLLGGRVEGAVPLHAHGRPVLITANDHRLGLANGDLGVLWGEGGRLAACFPDGQGGVRRFAPARLPACETGWATTVHKAQGSEAPAVIVCLPPDGGNASRELLYTAVTRARERVVVVADVAVTAGVLDRQAQRHTGLAGML